MEKGWCDQVGRNNRDVGKFRKILFDENREICDTCARKDGCNCSDAQARGMKYLEKQYHEENIPESWRPMLKRIRAYDKYQKELERDVTTGRKRGRPRKGERYGASGQPETDW